MNKSKQLSVNLITQVITFVLNLGISFFLTPYVIEHIGKDVYGFVNLANNFTSYVSVFTIALNGIVNRYVTIAYTQKNYKSASTYFSSVVFSNVAIMLILIPVTIFVTGKLEIFINLPIGFENDIKILFLLVFISYLINIPCGCYSVSTYAKNRLDKSNISNLISSVIRISSILILLFFSSKVWCIGLATLISTIYIIIKNIKYKRELTPEIHLSIKYFKMESVKELLGVGIWNSINQLTQLLLTGLDLVIANVLIGVTSMNLLSYAKMIPTQMLSLISMISGLFAPLMTIAYASKNKKSFVYETNFSIKMCGFLCGVPTVGLIVFGENFFKLWLTSLSENDIHTISILSILTVIPQFFSVYIYPLYTVNTVTAKLKIPVLVSGIIGVLNIVIVLVLIKTTSLGIYAVAGVSSVLSIFRILLFAPIYAAHNISVPFSTFYKPLIRGLFGSVLILIVLFAIQRLNFINNWISFFIICATSGIIGYFISFLMIFNKSEKAKIINLVKRKFGKKI